LLEQAVGTREAQKLFGNPTRERGHSLVPEPPQRITGAL
jgi:hypothetical protein